MRESNKHPHILFPCTPNLFHFLVSIVHDWSKIRCWHYSSAHDIINKIYFQTITKQRFIHFFREREKPSKRSKNNDINCYAYLIITVLKCVSGVNRITFALNETFFHSPLKLTSIDGIVNNCFVSSWKLQTVFIFIKS